MQNSCIKFIVAGLLTIATASGCAQLRGHYVVDDVVSDRDTTSTDGSVSPGPLNLDTYIFSEDLIRNFSYDDKVKGKKVSLVEFNTLPIFVVPSSEVFQSAFSRALNSKKDRDRLQFEIIRRSNEICEVHQGAILANNAFLNFSTGLVSTILSGVSAAVGGEVVKTALSTASAAVGATGAEINSNFYQNLLATAIVRKMNQLRATQYNHILTEQAKSLESYSISQAVVDASVYHSKCSFFVGVMALAADTKEDLSFAQIEARIDALQEENKELTQVIGVDDERKAAAEMQLRFNETEILRLKVLSRSATGAPVKKQDSAT